ncbi:MAG: ATP-binding protein [Betaproteobacteria bacterium]
MSTEPACSWRDPWRQVWAWVRLSLCAWHWLVLMALALAVPAIQAQLKAPTPDPLAGRGTQVEQHLFLDETQSLSLEEARAADYSAFSPLQRLPMEGKTVWLRLSITRVDGESGPLYLRLLPPVFERVILHTPDVQATGGWRATDLSEGVRSRAVALGDMAKTDSVFLQIKSIYATGLIAFAGTRDEVASNKHSLDIALAMVSTMLVSAWVVMLWKVFTHFNHLSLAVSVFLPMILIRVWIMLGCGPQLLSLTPEWEIRLYVPSVSAMILSAGWVIHLLATEVFQGSRWFAWRWAWVALALCNLILSFVMPEWALRISDGLMLWGAVLMVASLIVAAIKTPQSLSNWPAKIAFLTLITVALLGLLAALQLQGFAPDLSALQQPDRVLKTILVRSLMPIALIIIASWTYERLHRERISRMQSDLVNTTASLELESKRLERQRNFTAMLAHELKNPLTASQMALAGIQQRLSDDDPTQQRAEKIKNSLQEINAIVDRCAEVDGYEQGQMPMAVHTFAVQQLLDLVEAANPNERIYTLVRGLPEGAALSSDLHYIKLILNNLLSNALKYSPPDSLVELQVCSRQTEQSTQVDISVTNEVGAAGVPDPRRLFERFYRAESARNQSGAGLGLWLSQALAGALGTSIVSQAEDNWISFTLTLTLNDVRH